MIQNVFHICSYSEKNKISKALFSFMYFMRNHTNSLVNKSLLQKNYQNAVRAKHSYLSTRCYSRIPKSWFRQKKKMYDIVEIQEVSPKRDVPSYILRPDYAESGVATEQKFLTVLSEKEMILMRQSCALAKVVLEEVAKQISVSFITA